MDIYNCQDIELLKTLLIKRMVRMKEDLATRIKLNGHFLNTKPFTFEKNKFYFYTLTANNRVILYSDYPKDFAILAQDTADDFIDWGDEIK